MWHSTTDVLFGVQNALAEFIMNKYHCVGNVIFATAIKLALKCLCVCYLTAVVAGLFNTLRPRQNWRHFADDIFKCILLNENALIAIKISLKFVPKGPINNIPALVQIMAWLRPGDKPLSEPMMASLLAHISITRPEWAKNNWRHNILHMFHPLIVNQIIWDAFVWWLWHRSTCICLPIKNHIGAMIYWHSFICSRVNHCVCNFTAVETNVVEYWICTTQYS